MTRSDCRAFGERHGITITSRTRASPDTRQHRPHRPCSWPCPMTAENPSSTGSAPDLTHAPARTPTRAGLRPCLEEYPRRWTAAPLAAAESTCRRPIGRPSYLSVRAKARTLPIKSQVKTPPAMRQPRIGAAIDTAPCLRNLMSGSGSDQRYAGKPNAKIIEATSQYPALTDRRFARKWIVTRIPAQQISTGTAKYGITRQYIRGTKRSRTPNSSSLSLSLKTIPSPCAPVCPRTLAENCVTAGCSGSAG